MMRRRSRVLDGKSRASYRGFKKMEWEGWQQRAPYYHDRLGRLTAQATGHILDAVGTRPGMRLQAQLFGLLLDAVTTYSKTTDALPCGPPFFQFSDPAVGAEALERTGFRDVSALELELIYEGSSTDELLDWFEKSTVRVSVLYRLQPAEVKSRIRGAIASATSSYVTGGKLRIPCLGNALCWPKASVLSL